MIAARRIAVAGLLASMAPLVVGAVAVSPAAAATGYDQYGLTALASGVRTAGDIGNAGGLVTLDTGSGYVAARLDASPSSGVLADPYEPGTLFRTAAGQVNAAAGSEVVVVPDAQAAYPGEGKASLETVPPQHAGPLTIGGGSATAAASESSATGSATGAALTITGALESEGSTSSVEMHADAASGPPALRFLHPSSTVEISPADAQRLKLFQGDRVVVGSDGATVDATVTLRDATPEGTVFMETTALDGPLVEVRKA